MHDVKRRIFCDENTKIMSSHQIRLLDIAYFAAFLWNIRTKDWKS